MEAQNVNLNSGFTALQPSPGSLNFQPIGGSISRSPNFARSNSPSPQRMGINDTFMRQSVNENMDELLTYNDEILKKEQEIKEIAILKLRKLESVVRTKDALILELESQVEALNKQCIDLDQKYNKEYQSKFVELRQLFDEKDASIQKLIADHKQILATKNSEIEHLNEELHSEKNK